MKHKTWWKRLLFWHPLLVILLWCAALPMLIYGLAVPDAHPAVVYGSYALSAYALVLLVLALPRMIRMAQQFRDTNRIALRFRGDTVWRTSTMLRFSLILNTLYAALQLVSGFYYRSIWFYALAAYYALLALVRLFVLRRLRREHDLLTEWKCHRFCGAVLLMVNQALVVIVTFIVWQNRGFSYNEILTIAMAAYTFYSLTMAIVHMIRYRKYESPMLSAADAVSFTSALVSLLSLETAMIAAFDTAGNALFRQIITACTGGVVSLVVLALAIWMLIRSSREIRKIKQGVLS